MPMTPDSETTELRRPAFDEGIIGASILISVLPLLLHHTKFGILMWFHDDWEVLANLDELGAVRWLFQPIVTNFVPLFKLFWMSAVYLFQGSYFAMIILLWLTHLVNLILFARLLRQFQLSTWTISFAVITLGIAWSNIESLGWSAQWGQLLSIMFFLLAWHSLVRLLRSRKPQAGDLALFVLWITASALCFLRGMLTGPVMALFIVASARLYPHALRVRISWVLLSLAPACLLFVFVYFPHFANFTRTEEMTRDSILQMTGYAFTYELLNPLYWLIRIPGRTVDVRALIIYGVLKFVIVGFVLWKSKGTLRSLMLALLVFDLATSVLLGLFRYKTGVDTAVSSRYQYVSLLCFSPFLGAVVQRLIGRFANRVALVSVLLAWTVVVRYPWGRRIDYWARWRGSDIRRILLESSEEQCFGLSPVPTSRARELARIYNLH